MAVYAGYETLAQLPGGALTVVWKARRAGQTDEAGFVVKVCRAVEWVEDLDLDAGVVAAFSDAAADLKRLSDGSARHWVPMLASGATAQEAFWVTRFYPRSLERMLLGRYELTPLDLHWLVSAIVAGLIELQGALQRPHGNLKPSNIYIDGAGRLAGAPVLLSDLRSRRDMAAMEEGAVADYRALGRLIVQIVRRRSSEGLVNVGWPIQTDREWRQLGKGAEGWLGLCNTLLNPRLDPATLSWEEVAERLERLTPPRRRPWLLVTGLALPFVVVGAGVAWLRYSPYDTLPAGVRDWAEKLGNIPDTILPPPAEWALLCRAYNNWAGRFVQSVANPDQTAAWMRDPYLKREVVDRVRDLVERHKKLSPLDLAGVNGDLELLADNPPSIVCAATNARARVIEVYTALDAAVNAFENWPDRRKLGDLAARLEEQGWPSTRRELDAVLARGEAHELAVEVVSATFDWVTLGNRAVSLLGELDGRFKQLATGDKVLSQVPDLLRGRLTGARDLRDLLERLEAVNREAGRLVVLAEMGAADPRHDRSRFQSESFVAQFGGQVDDGVLARWEAAWADYGYLQGAADPRANQSWDALLRAIDTGLASARDEATASAQGEGAAEAALIQRLADAREQLRLDILALQGGRWVRADIPVLNRRIEDLKASISRLDEQTKSALVQLRPDPVGWLANVRRQRIGVEDGQIDREWARRRDALLGEANTAQLASSPSAFRALRDRVRQMQGFFEALAGAGGEQGLAAVDVSGISPALVPGLQSWARGRRDETVAAWLAGVTWNAGAPALPAGDFLNSNPVRQSNQRYTAALSEARQAASEGTDLLRQLDEGYGWEEPVSRIAPQWRERAPVQQLAGEAGWGDLLRALDQLSALNAGSDRAALVLAARSPRLSLAITAWRLLGERSDWPAANELDTELTLTKTLRGGIEQLPVGTRRSALLGELNNGARARWRAAMRLAQDDETVAAVITQREAFGVRDEDLNATDRYNLELLRWKRTNWRTLGDDEIVSLRDEAVRNLGDRLQAVPTVSRRWIDELAGIGLTDAAGKSDPRQLGPGAVGWTGEMSAEGRRVKFTKTTGRDALALSFALVERDDAVPYFLGTEEVSVAVVADVMSDARQGAELKPMLETVATTDEDPRLGAQVWRPDRRRILTVSDGWTGTPLPTWPKPLFLEDLRVPVAPTRDMPIQYLPPLVARRLAEALGARLPSPDEWRLALDVFHPSLTGANVRDRLWQREQTYLLDAGVTLDSPLEGDLFWPRSLGTMPRGRETRAVAETDDGYLWFAPTQDGGTGVANLFGNVSEYLHDPAADAYFVAGGSALSPPEIDPATPYPVEALFALAGFSDVGFRLAFDAPGSLAGRNRLLLLLRQQPFLH